MNVEEHLLTCLAEECAEVAQHACKALRFGIDDRDPTIAGSPTERAQILLELNDIFAVAELMQERKMLAPMLTDRMRIEAKKAKVKKFMAYAREHGALQDD